MNRTGSLAMLLGGLLLSGAGCAHRSGNGGGAQTRVADGEVISQSPSGGWSVVRAEKTSTNGDSGPTAMGYWIAERSSGRIGAPVTATDGKREWPRVDAAYWSAEGSLVACVIRYSPTAEGLVLFRQDLGRWREISVEDINWPYHWRSRRQLAGGAELETRGERIRSVQWKGNDGLVAEYDVVLDNAERVFSRARASYSVGRSRARLSGAVQWLDDRVSRR